MQIGAGNLEYCVKYHLTRTCSLGKIRSHWNFYRYINQCPWRTLGGIKASWLQAQCTAHKVLQGEPLIFQLELLHLEGLRPYQILDGRIVFFQAGWALSTIERERMWHGASGLPRKSVPRWIYLTWTYLQFWFCLFVSYLFSSWWWLFIWFWIFVLF